MADSEEPSTVEKLLLSAADKPVLGLWMVLMLLLAAGFLIAGILVFLL
jgi:hypothetical protein